MNNNQPEQSKEQSIKYQLLIGHKVKIDDNIFGEIMELRGLHARVKYIGEGGERTSLVEYERLSVNYPNKEIKNKDIISERDYWRMHYNKTQDTLDKVTTKHYRQPDNKAVDLESINAIISDYLNSKVFYSDPEDGPLLSYDDRLSENIIEFLNPYLSTPQKALSEGKMEKYLNDSIDACSIKSKEFTDKGMLHSKIASNAMAAAYNNVKQFLTQPNNGK